MIRGKGKLIKVDGKVACDEFQRACERLPDGDDYLFAICDNNRNRNLPVISFYFAVVLSYISDSLPGKPSTTALYKYFEDMFAPVHVVRINGQQFEYCDLKSELSHDIGDVIERVVEYARTEWGIEVPTKEEIKDPKLRELYSQAYLEQKADWSSFISSRKLLSKDERRNQETQRI